MQSWLDFVGNRWNFAEFNAVIGRVIDSQKEGFKHVRKIRSLSLVSASVLL